MIHKNSLFAWATSKKTLSERARLVLDYVKHHGAMTDKSIAQALGFNHKSAVQPRISELVAMGLLHEVGSDKDPETGKTVRKVAYEPSHA